MNSILDIIDKRHLHKYLILFQVYLFTRGRTNTIYQGNLKQDMKELLKDDFSQESFEDAVQYLISEDLVANNNASRLSVKGRDHFEKWINEFAELDENEKILLNNNLPEDIKKYLGIGKDVLVTIKTAKDLFEHFSN